MSKKPNPQIEEAKRWDEWIVLTREFVIKYKKPTLIQLSEALGCSMDTLENIGELVDGFKVTKHNKQCYRRVILSQD